MPEGFAHTPYREGVQPFSIGLRPIPPVRWLMPDRRLGIELAEKEALLASRREVILRERGDTRAAQAELLDLVTGHLIEDHAERYCRNGSRIAIDDGAILREGVGSEDPPILTAALLVQDDLVLMRREVDGWRLVAACLCFPSTWSLAEKFDRPMATIHAEVPGYAGQMATRVERIFDRLPDDVIVERFNWSIYGDAALHHPEPRSGPRPWRGNPGGFLRHGHIRVERQTLRRLPRSRDIVFTIRVHVDPVAMLGTRPDGPELAAHLHGQLAAMDTAQLAYKGLMADRDVMLGDLEALAAQGQGA
jgi:dimethylamine monooxygenase subunit A